MFLPVKQRRVISILGQRLGGVLGVVELAVGPVHTEPLLIEKTLFLTTRPTVLEWAVWLVAFLSIMTLWHAVGIVVVKVFAPVSVHACVL